ncbi:MAG: arsenic transporter [Tissierella sp.]|nr:arsenic transporter [Tissierella sp.]
MKLAIIIFVLTYALLIIFPNYRAYIALGSGVVFIALGILPVEKVFTAIDWNVILMIAGTMGIVSLFIESKMPSLLADIILEKVPNVKWAIISLSLFAGLISAFIDNVATVLMVAPIALNISKKLNMSPVKSVIAIAVASNLQGAATLVGDTTSILLGGYAGMNFFDFFFFKGKIGMFWIIQAGAMASTLILLKVFKKDNQKIDKMGRTIVKDFFPSYLLVGMIILLIIASFLPNMPSTINGIICVTLLIIGLIRDNIIKNNANNAIKIIKEIDYFTIILLAGLFIVIAGITEAGVVDEISKIFVRLSGDNLFAIYTIIVWASVIFSAFIDNIPYIATMLPVVQSISIILGIEPYILYFGLLSGATLGGNMTPIGASANIAGLGILRKEGHDVSASTFMKIGVPFTLAAVTVGYILIWLIWS